MLKVVNLVKKFGNNTILNVLNFEINKGEKVAIIGPSGSGKSTILRILTALEESTSGEIYFEQTKIDKKNIPKIRHKIGILFQQFNLFANLNIIDNIVLSPIKTKFLTKEESYQKARKLLKRMGRSE